MPSFDNHPVETTGVARELPALLESLAVHLLRLEDRSEPSIAALALPDSDELARAKADGSPAVASLANLMASTIRDIAEGRIPGHPRIAGALISISDMLAANLGSSDNSIDPTCVAALSDALATAIAETSSEAPKPSPSRWPAPSGELPADLLAQFTTEAMDSINEAEGALLELEQQGDNADAVHRLFRAVHSIKGTAGYVGLNQIQALSHQLESVLALVRNGQISLADGVSELVFQGVDFLKGMIGNLSVAGEANRDLAEFVDGLIAVCGQTLEQTGEREVAIPDTVFQNAATQHLDGLTDGIRSIAAGDCSDAVLSQLRRSAASLQSSATFVGRTEFATPTDELLTVLTRLATVRERLSTAVGSMAPGGERFTPTKPVVQIPVAEKVTPSAPSKTVAPEQANSSRSAGNSKTMRVDQKKLDDYVNLAGELVIARNSLVHSLRQCQADRGLKDAVEKVCRIVGDVQNNAMGMRMIPVGTVFQRFPRLVRDIAKTLGKHIELELQGEDTELDKQVAEALSDPLIHLVRNAADHGVEMPETRRLAGKRETGVITLRAGREGNSIVIDIQDDGGGIDAERLKAKALSSGVITAEQADSMTREQALDLVFAPGLSTARVVSDLSGRGVGMDVVRNNISALGGSVSIRSEPNQGSCIRLSLPLTLAVTTVVLVEAGGMTFGLPIDVVRETLKVMPDSFRHLRGIRAVTLRGDVIPVKPLSRLIGLGGPADESAGNTTDRVPVVVLAVGGTRFGVTVDALKGQQEIVLKPVPPQLGQIEGVSGATIMGDGGIVLVLDPAGLYRRALTADKDIDSQESLALSHR